MRVQFLNNDGGGFADFVETDPNITIEAFFTQRMPGRKTEDFLIRVNRQPVTRDTILQAGDRVSITPTKFEGAGHGRTRICPQ